jgi:hypothetical protein
MVVIAGSIVLVAALIVAIVGVPSNAGPTHPQTDFSMFGYHVTGSAGTLFALRILVGAVAMLGLSGRMAGVRRTADRGRDAPLGRHHHGSTTPEPRSGVLGQWWGRRQPVGTGHLERTPQRTSSATNTKR